MVSSPLARGCGTLPPQDTGGTSSAKARRRAGRECSAEATPCYGSDGLEEKRSLWVGRMGSLRIIRSSYGDADSERPPLRAYAAICRRVCSASFSRMLWTCPFTVFVARCRRCAISLLLNPSAIRSNTARSRAVKRGGRSVHRRDDLQIRLLGEHRDDAVAHQSIVLDYQNRDFFRHGGPFAGGSAVSNSGWRLGGVRTKQRPTKDELKYAAHGRSHAMVASQHQAGPAKKYDV